jgi:hypothetical protein
MVSRLTLNSWATNNNIELCLVSNNNEQYIVNLKCKKITWRRAEYYESPSINFKTDMLNVVVISVGKLIKTLGFDNIIRIKKI